MYAEVKYDSQTMKYWARRDGNYDAQKKCWEIRCKNSTQTLNLATSKCECHNGSLIFDNGCITYYACQAKTGYVVDWENAKCISHNECQEKTGYVLDLQAATCITAIECTAKGEKYKISDDGYQCVDVNDDDTVEETADKGPVEEICGAGFCFVSAENKTCLPIEGGKLGGRSITPKGMCVTCGATTMPVLSDGKWTCDKGCISTMAHMRACFARNDFRKCVMEKSGCGGATTTAGTDGVKTPDNNINESDGIPK
jgi:hypothetical protein